jgi:flagellar hook-associated protein 2
MGAMSSPLTIANNTNTSANSTANIYAQVSSIMQARNKTAPLLNAALNADTTTLSGLGQLQSALASFQNAAQSLSGIGLNLSATSSTPEVLSAITSSNSVAGTYAIQITQLAQSQALQSKTQASQTAAIGLGVASKITLDFGTTSGNTFNTSANGKSVTIPSGTNTLQSIASAINGANIGVTAKVIPIGTGYALELHSPTGAASSMRIAVTGDPALKNLLAYDPAGVKNLSPAASAQNATLTVNGTAMSSPSNTLTNAVPGTTLSLTATGTSNLVVAQDSAQLTQNVTNLVNAYNTLNAKLNTLKQGNLKTDGSALQTQTHLRNIFITSIAHGVSGSPSLALAKIGITTQKNGVMTIDASKLQNAISTDPASVTKIFTNGGKGLADHLANQIQGLIGPAGSLAQKTTAINHDITALNAKQASLQKALTAQANALVSYYSQQSTPGTSTATTSSSSTASSGTNSPFNFLR